MKKIVIVGGVAGGATVASQIKRTTNESEIHIYEKNGYPAFSNCGMPYVIGGTVHERSAVLQSPEEFEKTYGVHLHLHHEVTAIDREHKRVTVVHENKSETVSYDTLILSPGGHAFLPDIKGATLPHCFRLRSIEDMDAIMNYCEEKKPKTAVIVGGGAIGIEMAEAFYQKQITTTILEKNDAIMSKLDTYITDGLHADLQDHGVSIALHDEITDVKASFEVETKNNGTIRADIVIFAAGTLPNTSLAEKATLTIGTSAGIQVNEYCQTNDPSIYALGDAIEVMHSVTGQPIRVPLAWPAHRQAYIIANHLAGKEDSYNGSLATSIVKGITYVVASTGASPSQLEAASIRYERIEHESKQHAGYYPGAAPIRLLVFFDPQTRKILGGQAGGVDGVDKRIDLLSSFILLGGTIDQLAELEIAYAPPFSSPKDPLNIVGYKGLQRGRN